MQSLIAAQQLLTSANSGLTAAQQQQLLAQMSSSLSQLSAAQQQQLLASLMGSTSMGSMAGMTSRYVVCHDPIKSVPVTCICSAVAGTVWRAEEAACLASPRPSSSCWRPPGPV